MKEFLDLLTKYVSGERPLSDVGEWLAGVAWDDADLTPDSKEVLGLFEVLATEVSEGLRDQRELLSEAVTLLTKRNRSVFLQDVTAELTIRASAVDTSAIMVSSEQGQRTWSISPQLVIS